MLGPGGQAKAPTIKAHPYLIRANYLRWSATPLSLNSDTGHLGGLPYHRHYPIARQKRKQKQSLLRGGGRSQMAILDNTALMTRLAEQCLPQVLGACEVGLS